MKNINLKKGVDIHIIEAPKFKTNLLSVYLYIPLKRETITKAALLPSVLKRGCTAYPTLKDISCHLDDMYSASASAGVRTKGDGEVLFFTAEYISDKYVGENLTVPIAEFLKEIIFSPLTENGGFNKSYTESEKINLRNAIQGLYNDKKEYAEFKCREAMFGKNGCGMFEVGYEEDLDDITPQNLYEFYTDVLNTAKVDIFVSGTANEQTINDITRILGPLFKPRDAEYILPGIKEYKRDAIQKITEDADVVQSKLCMGLICNVEPTSDEYYSLILANSIFGGTPFSKLFNNVREKLSLAYYAFSRTARFDGYMMISSGIQTENYQKAYDEIMVQFDKMINGEIEDSEINAAKNYMHNAYTAMEDSLKRMEDYWLSQTIMGTNQNISDLLNGISAVTKDDIISVMKKVKFDTIYFLKGKEAANL